MARRTAGGWAAQHPGVDGARGDSYEVNYGTAHTAGVSADSAGSEGLLARVADGAVFDVQDDRWIARLLLSPDIDAFATRSATPPAATTFGVADVDVATAE
jgi:hypothetical protein